VTTVPLGTGGSVGSIIAGVEIEADGSIFVIGSGDSRTGEIELVRLTSGGALDDSFGADGLATTVVGPCGHADSAMLSPDGSVLVAGHTCTGVFVIRFEADGTVDTTFGSNGVFTDDPVGLSGNNFWTVGAIGMDSSGRVVLTGRVTVSTTVKSKDFVVRLTADGALDPTFGTGGSVVGLFGPFTTLGFDASGRIVVGGDQVYRLNPDGSVDSTFGTNGLVYLKSFAVAIEVDSQNRIVVIEGSDGHESVFQRFASDGSPDPTFGPGGELLTSGWAWTAAVIEADGTAVAVGAKEDGPNGETDDSVIAIGRYTLGPAF
jgi:uncharacterized delta-60 repeat protein